MSTGRQSEATKRMRARGKGRRWLRVLAILGVLVVVVVVVAVVGGFLWWRNYQSTPTYTLTLLIDAAQRNDPAEFQKRINDDEIAKNMVASVSQKAAARYGLAFNSSVQEKIDNLRAVAVAAFEANDSRRSGETDQRVCFEIRAETVHLARRCRSEIDYGDN